MAPVSFTEAEPVIRVVVAGVEQDCVLDVPAGTEVGPYFVSGDGEADDVLQLVLDALNALPGGVTFSGSISDYNLAELVASGAVRFLWAHANTTFDPALLGFEAVDTASSATHTGAFMTRGCWIPGLPGDPRAVLEDTDDEPVTGAVVTLTLDGAARGYDLSPEADERLVSFYRLEAGRVLEQLAPSSAPYGAFATLWTEDGLAAGAAFRYYPDRTDRGTYGTYSSVETKRPWKNEPIENGVRRYTLELSLMEAI